MKNTSIHFEMRWPNARSAALGALRLVHATAAEYFPNSTTEIRHLSTSDIEAMWDNVTCWQSPVPEDLLPWVGGISGCSLISDPTICARVQPIEAYLFRTTPNAFSDHIWIGMARHPGTAKVVPLSAHLPKKERTIKVNRPGWQWLGDMRPHMPDTLGVDNQPTFIQGHVGAVVVLARAAQCPDTVVTVSDSGRYWDTCALGNLLEKVGQSPSLTVQKALTRAHAEGSNGSALLDSAVSLVLQARKARDC